MNGKWQELYLSTKVAIEIYLETIGPFQFYQPFYQPILPFGQQHEQLSYSNKDFTGSETDNNGEDTLSSQKRSESGITPVAKDTVIVTENSGTKTVKTRITGHQKLSLLGIPSLNILTKKKLAKRKVSKYMYPGKSAEDIEAELRTIKVNLMPSHIIIHAGTNNIPVDSAEVCVKKIESLVLKTKSKFPDSKIGVSGITMRQDIEVGQNIKQVNKKLEDLSKNHNISFIDNSSINNTCLNGGKLHF
ncbi:Hypothetical predicted protein [Paramuricea clavata]|uniref:Uncharacterized protein n=1 Tax=Paramuricea clavata TaxID=317549 RepID=A0A7D9D8W5_PARCT|nr:Hypothetical predicted protein [Paramuricea clavata]